MIVPITFNSDSTSNLKKGKIRPEDMAALNAFSLSGKTGILPLLNQCSYSNITYPANGVARVAFRNGYVSICGRLAYIEDSSTVDITLPSSGSQTGYICIKVDLTATGDSECSIYAETGSLQQDDLNENPTLGIYEFPLYAFTATSNSVSIGSKGQAIPKGNEAVYPYYPDGRTQSQTIGERLDDLEDRLTKAGFREGVLGMGSSGVTPTRNSIIRSGRNIIVNFEGTVSSTSLQNSGYTFTLTIPQDQLFKPTESVTSYVEMYYEDPFHIQHKVYGTATIRVLGQGITIKFEDAATLGDCTIKFNCGYVCSYV